MLLNFVRAGLQFGIFAEIRSIIGEMGLPQVADDYKFLIMPYTIRTFETQPTRIFVIGTKDKSIAQNAGLQSSSKGKEKSII